jgi:hypothetical protein
VASTIEYTDKRRFETSLQNEPFWLFGSYASRKLSNNSRVVISPHKNFDSWLALRRLNMTSVCDGFISDENELSGIYDHLSTTISDTIVGIGLGAGINDVALVARSVMWLLKFDLVRITETPF